MAQFFVRSFFFFSVFFFFGGGGGGLGVLRFGVWGVLVFPVCQISACQKAGSSGLSFSSKFLTKTP